MNFNKVQRIKSLEDQDILCYAVKINNKYILIYFKSHPIIYTKLTNLFLSKSMKYASLKREIQILDDVTLKENKFTELSALRYFIGLA